MMLKFILCLALVVSFAGLRRGNADVGQLGGLAFADYYYVAAVDDADPLPENQNAFRFRRVYLTYNRAISERFDMRLRLEANDAGFGSRTKMTPFLKHAYLKWNGALGGDLYIGESATPTWSISESFWGYRAIEKTILDLNGIGSSADIGLGLKGTTGGLGYHMMIANGPGQRPETDNGKKFYGSVALHPSQALIVEIYGDFDMRPTSHNRVTAKAFVGLQTDAVKLGLEPFIRVNREAGGTGEDVMIAGASIFGSLPMGGDDRVFGRLDLLNNDDADTTDLLVIAGYDWTVEKGVHIMPNLYVELPDDTDGDVQGRVTAYYKF